MTRSETLKQRKEEVERFEQSVKAIAAGLPKLLKHMTPDQLRRIQSIWGDVADALADESYRRRKDESSKTPPKVERLWAELDRELDEEGEKDPMEFPS